MAPVILHAIILQATSRSMIFRKCATCKSRIVGIAHNHELRSAGVLYYCVECNKEVDEYQSNYELPMTVSVLNGEKVQNIVAYDRAVELLLGCNANRLGELMLKDTAILDELEEQLIGTRCHLVIRQEKKKNKGKKNDRTIVEAIIPANPLFMPLFANNEVESWEP
ncbi:hypothetical protein BDB00DRAFT_858013 [Zychaea mexicana]|uniref:uncharacterized protein n=1 Tax=Zychaea mexicana TaxID=64656 RepID=UPI0022FEF58C|nr:uncharacterized protein BDB00DRAFT_858013 [Zychaea mexicana]KAI9479626.1 hypothetical protein BDB00DRAFT_858013 [Zychaea mexicana]